MTRIIAEIGCNHKGDMAIARDLVRVAADVCKAHIVKFQKRSPGELLSPEEYNRPHPVPENSYGPTYGAHREALELDLDQHAELKELCDGIGIEYSCSVWDLTSAREIASLKPRLIKIPSATNQHYELQEFLCKNYDGEIHVSTGMTTRDETEELVAFYENHDRAKDLVLYACTSGYPVAFEDVCLFEIDRLQELYGNRIKATGFSGHHLGIAADVAALAIGKKAELDGRGKFSYIERHFTLDRTWKGTDHAASLEPDGLRRLCRDIEHIGAALAHKHSEILDVEEIQRQKLKWAKSRQTGLRLASPM